MKLQPGHLHGTAVQMADQGVLIVGASGSGKSSLALHLLALGATLISDDVVSLSLQDDTVWIDRPKGAPEYIEARGLGLLRAPYASGARLDLIIDLDRPEETRLPPLRYAYVADRAVPLFHNVTNGTFPVAILQYLLHGRHNPDA